MVHIHELIDWTVSVFIVHRNTVLLRMHDKYNTLLAVGGHIELDEDPAAAAKRECMEEVGLPVHIAGEKDIEIFIPEENFRYLPTPDGMNIHRINDKHQHIDIVYYATCIHTNIVPERPEDTWEWLTKEEILARTDLRDNIKKYALDALETLGQK